MPARCISVVLPVYNEAENIAECLRALEQALAGEEHEILVCYDFDGDTTLTAIDAMPDAPTSVRRVKNDLGRGVAYAMRAGFAAARGDVVVSTMADLSDPPTIIPAMAAEIRNGAHVVSGSRYMRGGSQVGGPRLKSLMSRWAGLSLHWIAGVTTHDATNNFRAYSREFLQHFPVQSVSGFEVGLELTVKAHLHGWRISEVPSSWRERHAGESRFRLWRWLPRYLAWYFRAMVAPVSVGAVWIGASAALVLTRARLRPALGLNFPIWVIVGGLSVGALAVLIGLRRFRGRTHLVDAIAPLVLLIPPWLAK